jgi:hypothetical protein
MKKLYILATLFLSLFLAACSNNSSDMSPVSPQLEKTDKPSTFELYQTFPEYKEAKVDWAFTEKGFQISLHTSSSNDKFTLLFAIIELSEFDRDANQMIYLGELRDSYLLTDFPKMTIGAIRIYAYTGKALKDNPHSDLQLFSSLGVREWSDGGNVIKVGSDKFPYSMTHLYAELSSVNGNLLVYTGKPYSEDFDFPKSEKFETNNVRLFGNGASLTETAVGR